MILFFKHIVEHLAISSLTDYMLWRNLFNQIEFELLALECEAPPGGRSKTGMEAAGAQRPTRCEAEGRASFLKGVGMGELSAIEALFDKSQKCKINIHS